MPPRGGNAKAESGKAKKAANAEKKASDAAAAAEAREAASWEDAGAKKGKGKESAEQKAEKRAEEARKKAERERMLAEEEASIPDGGKKSGGGAGGKKGSAKAGAAKADKFVPGGIDAAISSFSASNIDDALDAMSLATDRTDTAAQGAKASQLERHPERRFKAAFEAFKEREMTRIKAERPGMRSQQYHDALYKEFQKHPDNPFNQLTVAYDATKEEKLSALQGKRDATALRLAGE